MSPPPDRPPAQPPQAKIIRGTGPGKANPIETWRLEAGTTVCEVAPSRGGIVTRFAVDGDEILYLDSATLRDRSQKVRGGIPVLFPIAGALSGDRYTVGGRSYAMRQHGLARQAAWSVHSVGGARLVLEFRSTPATQASFPFDFIYRLAIDIEHAGFRSLVLESEFENCGREPMPLHHGFHPYFHVADAAKPGTRVDIPARSLLDNHSGARGEWRGEIDYTASIQDLHLSDLHGQTVTLDIPGKPRRTLTFSENYSQIVVWTTALKDFICIEPWSAPADALNTGTGLHTIAPGGTHRASFTIAV